MRQTLMGIVTAAAVMTGGAAPAMACGFGGCSPCAGLFAAPCAPAYVPSYTYNYGYTGCGACGGWGYERLVEPSTQYYPPTQYYYVNQGPTYSGPGAFAPYPTYQEDAYPGYYGYYHRWHHAYRPWHRVYRYGYARHHYGHYFLWPSGAAPLRLSSRIRP